MTAAAANDAMHAKLAAACTEHAQSQWAGFVNDTQSMIDAETGAQTDLDSGLRATVEEVEAAISRGEELLGTSLVAS